MPIDIDDTWASAEGEQDGMPLVIRVRSHLHALVGHPDLPNRLVIAWTYAPDGAPANDGMPTPAQTEALIACEDALVGGLEAGPEPAAVLVGAWTGSGRREWVWYGAEPAVLEVAVNEALADIPPLPLELELEADPDWTQYTQLLSDLGLA